MSDDELFVVMVAGFLSLMWAGRQLGPLLTLSRLQVPGPTRAAVLATWAVALGLVHATLANLAAWDVQSSAVYTGFYDVMGLAWIGGSVAALDWLGLSLRDDVLERRNPAAMAAWAGAVVGFAAAFAGGNVGDGPGWWCVVIASGFASSALTAVWVALHSLSGVAHAITIDRDLPAGLRTGALLAACGVIFGRAAAGDWVSTFDTIGTFVLGAWPAIPLVALAIAIELALRPRPRAIPAVLGISSGVALAYLGGAAVVLLVQGVPL